MREIEITNSISKLFIDDSDFELVSQYKWHYIGDGYIGAYLSKNKQIYVQNLLLGKKEGYKIDHIDRNRLNNQRNNLRYCTVSQNSSNASRIRGKSKFNGVYFFYKSWRARIGYKNSRISLGSFKSENEAALAYNKKAIELFGEFAKLNVIEEVQ